MAKSKTQSNEKTAPRPHHRTEILAVILAVAAIAATIGKTLIKASAQTTTNSGNGVAVGTNNGTIKLAKAGCDYGIRIEGNVQGNLQGNVVAGCLDGISIGKDANGNVCYNVVNGAPLSAEQMKEVAEFLKNPPRCEPQSK
jgi:hypothetical protein